jgi:hypothetical protein
MPAVKTLDPFVSTIDLPDERRDHHHPTYPCSPAAVIIQRSHWLLRSTPRSQVGRRPSSSAGSLASPNPRPSPMWLSPLERCCSPHRRDWSRQTQQRGRSRRPPPSLPAGLDATASRSVFCVYQLYQHSYSDWYNR